MARPSTMNVPSPLVYRPMFLPVVIHPCLNRVKNENVMFLDVIRYATFDILNAFPDQGRLDRLRLDRREPESFELIRVGT